MKLSITAKIASVTAVAVLALAVVGFVSHREFNNVMAATGRLSTSSTALRNHLECDMMHDALRADVLTALHGAANNDAAAISGAQADLRDHARNFRDRLAANQQLALAPEVVHSMGTLKTPLDAYISSAENLIGLAARDAKAAEKELPAFQRAFETLESPMSDVSDVMESVNQAIEKQIAVEKSSFVMWLAGLVVVSLVILSSLTVIVARSVPHAFRELASALSGASHEVADAASHVSEASHSLASGASQQAASLEETSASLEEMAAMAKRNAEGAQKANELARAARTAAERGVVDMQAMTRSMETIRGSSDDIGKIIKTIDEIAFQTNILALNAAVEAARAGEAGMGFAVVADEVRSLAQRSAKAARETSEKIEAAVSNTTHGVELSSQVAQMLNEIAEKVRQVDELASAVASASGEQTQGITQINTAVAQMDRMTQSNAASAEESSGAAQEMGAQATVLKDIVSQLLGLVNGTSEPVHFKAANAARRKSNIKKNGNDHTPANGDGPVRQNGHGQLPKPAAAATPVTSPKRSEIPLEGEFQDF